MVSAREKTAVIRSMRRLPALDVPTNATQDDGRDSVAVEARDVQPQPTGVALKILVSQRVLVIEEQPVHIPEPPLKSGCFRCGRRSEGVRVDLRERKVPEREPDPAVLLLHLRDRFKRLPRVRTLVVAVLHDEATFRGAADVVDLLVKRLQCRLIPLRHRVARHLV
jgi:hypothetical protein